MSRRQEDCQHEDFNFNVEVARIATEDGGPVEMFNVHLRMTCKGCGIPFSFEGLPRGINLTEPVTGVMGIEARLPVHPLREEDKQGETMRVLVPGSLEERKEMETALREALKLAFIQIGKEEDAIAAWSQSPHPRAPEIRQGPDDYDIAPMLEAKYPTLYRCLMRMLGGES